MESRKGWELKDIRGESDLFGIPKSTIRVTGMVGNAEETFKQMDMQAMERYGVHAGRRDYFKLTSYLAEILYKPKGLFICCTVLCSVFINEDSLPYKGLGQMADWDKVHSWNLGWNLPYNNVMEILLLVSENK